MQEVKFRCTPEYITNRIFCGDTLENLKIFPDECIDTVITSPPFYRQRLYNVPNEIGREDTPEEYIIKLVRIFSEVWRILKPTGSVWVEIGDKFNTAAKYRNGALGNVSDKTYNGNGNGNGNGGKIVKGLPKKTLLGIPERFFIAMIESGWTARNKPINYTTNAMPDSARDRYGIDYTNVYFFVKDENKYFFDPQYDPISEETLRESKYTVDLTNRKSQETRQGLNKWHPNKAYKDNNVQSPLDIKRRIVTNIRFGGNKQASGGYGKDTYSGNYWNMDSSNAVKLTPQDIVNAKRLGWDGVSNYAEWYFELREKKSWHDHSKDEEGGYGQQSRGQKPPQIPFPYGRIKRSVWKIPHGSSKDNHFAAFSEALVVIPLKSTCPPGGIAMDPFNGTGTTCIVALKHDRNYVGIDGSKEYCEITERKIREENLRRVLKF